LRSLDERQTKATFLYRIIAKINEITLVCRRKQHAKITKHFYL
jgi:hypothetical protein